MYVKQLKKTNIISFVAWPPSLPQQLAIQQKVAK